MERRQTEEQKKDTTIGWKKKNRNWSKAPLIVMCIIGSNACVFTNRHFMEKNTVGAQMENNNDRREMEWIKNAFE